MTDNQYRTAVREALEPLVGGVGEGPDWDDLTDRVQVAAGSRRLTGWAVAAITGLVVLVVLGVPALLSGPVPGGPSADGERPSVSGRFSETEAQATVTEWWSLVMADDTDSASAVAHPDAEFNYVGLSEWLSIAGERPRIIVDDRSFGSGDQPQLCFAIGDTPDLAVGSAVFRILEGRWRLWEIRTGTFGCVEWAESLDASAPQGGPEAEAAILAQRMAEAVTELGGFCERSSTSADFDGDGTVDLVAIGTVDCDGPADTRAWLLVVAWANGETESWPLDGCGIVLPEGRVRPTGICQVLAAPDLNRDGRAELMVKIQRAAGSISLFQIYVLTRDEAAQDPVEVGPGAPGPDEITPGQIFVGVFGSSSAYEENIRCVTDAEGGMVLLMTTAESQGDEWSVFEGTWQLERGLVSLLAQRTYSVAKDTPEASSLIAGQDICGAPVLDF